MQGGAVQGGGAGGQQQQQQRGNWMGGLLRMVMIYFMFNYFMRPKGGSAPAPQVDANGQALPALYNLWPEGTRLDLRVYLTESNQFKEFDDVSKLAWHQEDVFYDWRDSNNRETELVYTPSPTLQNNGTLFAHVFVTRTGYTHDFTAPNYDQRGALYAVHPLTKYLKQKKNTRKNLISGESVVPEHLQQINDTEIISFWKPNLTMHLVDDHSRYARGSIPPQIEQQMKIDYAEGYYHPTLFFDEFWLFREHLIAINDTVTSLPLTITYSPIGIIKWQLYLQMEESFKMQENIGTSAEGESDEFKRMLVETNPYLLGLTFVVTILHSVFDFLAFKNDIHFWKNKKNLEGMSVRTLFWNSTAQLIIFLYLLDNETSWIIIISSGIGVLIEFWKVQKATIVTIDWSKRIPISFKDRESYASKTREYDEQAMRYLSWVLFPLLFGYSIYSLVYDTHKSWYSWVLSSLTGCVYTFGFIMMTPQLFINYKLKSVAHLPWRAFTYKALNTFVDDLFAFIIKMPTMHRLSCFRDDIIFLIYLYQRWIYPVDKTRVNEFGQSGEDVDEATQDKKPAITNTDNNNNKDSGKDEKETTKEEKEVEETKTEEPKETKDEKEATKETTVTKRKGKPARDRD